MQSSQRESGFFCEINGLNVHEVQAYLEESNKSFEQSELYVAAEEKNIVDTSLRKSQFRKFTDAKLFDLVEPFVSHLSEEDPLLWYTLRRNDVTHIKYETGGFFGKHTDYLSVSSNLLEEFSFLVCVTPEAHVKPNQGGKTVIHMHRSSHTSDATTTPASGIAFRKDLEHEGTLLEAGEKHIIMLNLWATRKDSGGILSVHFDITTKAETQHVHTEDTLRQLACDQSYLIPIVEAKRSRRLAEHIQSSTRDQCCCCQGTGTVENFGVCPLCEGKCFFYSDDDQSCQSSSMGTVIQYLCKDCSYETFRTIFHILRRMYVSAEEMQAHAELIALYGLDAEHILIGVPQSIPGTGSSTQMTSITKVEECIEASTKGENSQHKISIYLMDGSLYSVTVAGSDSIRSLKKELKTRAGLSGIALFASNCERPLKDSDTIAACGFPTQLFTVKRMKKVDEYEVLGLTGDEVGAITDPAPANQAVEDDGSDVIVCESLERTRVVAEAAIEAGLPYASFQVLFIEGELVIRGDTCRPCNHKFTMDPAFISVGDCQHVLGWGSVSHDWEGNCRWWEDDLAKREHPRNPALFDLRRVLKPTAQITDVMQNVFGESTFKRSRELMSLTDHVSHFGPHPEISSENDGQLFYVNAQGKTAFTREQADDAASHLRDIFFIDQIKDRLNKVPWQFPQDSEDRRETLCNEQVYGHTIIMLVSGVVRLRSNREWDESSKREHHEYLRSRFVKEKPVETKSGVPG